MNVESLEDDFADPFFASREDLAKLEEQLYGHVLAAIDFDALHAVEQTLCMLLGDEFEIEDNLAIDLGVQLVSRALHRAVEDPRRVCDVGAPDGITDEEKAAVAFDETCPFCAFDRQQAEAIAKHKALGREEEFCDCCEMLREEWRKQHADVLAKAGLAKSAPSKSKAQLS